MKKTLFLTIFAGGFFLSAQSTTFSKFNAGSVPNIHPTGWLETLMQRQHDGLTGHPEALSYPYNSCLWAGEISRSDESYGGIVGGRNIMSIEGIQWTSVKEPKSR